MKSKEDVNSNSILFLYEGETEEEFYSKILDRYLTHRSIKISKSNLRGVYSLQDKVSNKIKTYLANKKYEDCHSIYVIVAYDREGERHIPASLDLKNLNKLFCGRKKRVVSISHVVATQDLESWFFNDLEGIYAYLQAPKKDRKLNKFPNIDKTNNKILSHLFHKFGRHYQKGKRAEGFIDKLNLDKIVGHVEELQEFIEFIITLSDGLDPIKL